MFRLEAENVMPRKNEVRAQIHVATDGQCTSVAKADFPSTRPLIIDFSCLCREQPDPSRFQSVTLGALPLIEGVF